MIPRSAALGAGLGALVVVLVGWLAQGGTGPARAAGEAEPPTVHAEYVAETTCRGCHEREFESWQTSHHAHAMEVPGPNSVRGDFEDAEFDSEGVPYRFFRRDGDYFVEMEGPDGETGAFKVDYTFGWTPLQQYLVELDRGRLQALTVAWDTEAGEWFDLTAADPAVPGDPFHWTGREYNWNFRCAECHSTDLRRNYTPATDSFETTYSAVNVGCQACHGPGAGHVEWISNGSPDSVPDSGFVVSADRDIATETCARCHSRRRPITGHYVAGEPFLDQYVPELLREGLYFADGQIDDEVFVYGSFMQSRMHRRGVTCSDCHDPHSGDLYADGNDVCTACHNETPPEKFATIRPLAYDSPAHHFHEAGKPGSFCVDCHMPSRTYMTVDPRRDHSFRVPRPDLSRETGSPDACTGCHTDRDPAWAASAIAGWYGDDRGREPHYGEALALGRRGAPGAATALSRLAADTGQPAIARATAVEMLSDFLDSRTLGAVSQAGHDGDPLVRLAAVQATGSLPPDERIGIAGPLLDDPVRAVRIAAARVLAPVPEEAFLGDRREPYLRAVDEYLASELAVAERPETHLNLGLYWSERGNAEKAEAAYLQSLALDPDYAPGMINLAELYRATDRSTEEAAILQRALDAGAGDAAVLHAAGLLRARQKRYDDALDLLGRAYETQPGSSRFAYVYAVALDSLGRTQDARQIRADALARDPYDVDLLAATLHQSLRDDDVHAARQLAARLSELRPDDVELQRLRERLGR